MILDRGYVHGGDVYSQPVRMDFSANVNPCGAPEAVKAAVREAASKLTDYPDPYCGLLREKLAALNGVDRENVICGNGAAELIYQFALALKPGKALLQHRMQSQRQHFPPQAGCPYQPEAL